MAWDFSTDPEFQKKLDWVDEFCREEVEPLDYVFPYAVRSPDPVVKAYVRTLQQQVKDQGLWAIFLDEELGGPGYGQLKLGLLNEVIGRYPSAPQMFGAAAPDTGNMEMLAAYGTPAQKERWLKPLLNQDMFSAYSMTEPQGGSDPNLFKTHAVRNGDEDRVIASDRSRHLGPSSAVESGRDGMGRARQRAHDEEQTGLVDLQWQVGQELAQPILTGRLGLDQARRQRVGRRALAADLDEPELGDVAADGRLGRAESALPKRRGELELRPYQPLRDEVADGPLTELLHDLHRTAVSVRAR